MSTIHQWEEEWKDALFGTFQNYGNVDFLDFVPSAKEILCRGIKIYKPRDFSIKIMSRGIALMYGDIKFREWQEFDMIVKYFENPSIVNISREEYTILKDYKKYNGIQ